MWQRIRVEEIKSLTPKVQHITLVRNSCKTNAEIVLWVIRFQGKHVSCDVSNILIKYMSSNETGVNIMTTGT